MSDDARAREGKPGGVIAWMVHHRVAPNLLMLVFILGGLLMASQIRQEVFPDFSADTVTVSVAYPGASPEEVEQGVVLAIEEAVRGIDGVEEVRSTATEGSAQVTLEIATTADKELVYNDVQQEVDRITTLPDDAEEPDVRQTAFSREVLDLLVYGDIDAWSLRRAAERVRDGLLRHPGISDVALQGARDFEIHVEVPQAALRKYDLTLDEVARIVSSSALDTAGGSLETDAGELLLRIQERKEWADQFATIPLITEESGTVLRLGDVATVKETLADTDRSATYNGQPAVGIEVVRVGDQTPISVSKAVRERLPEVMRDLPPSVQAAIQEDFSIIYKQRVQLLLKNGLIGLVLVLCVLSLFLELKLALWVSVGIGTAFLGTFLFLPAYDVSVNMVSLFAFIVALGIVVDDAIVAGENIYAYRQRGMGYLHAAVKGARDIAVPITFSVLTNIVAFLPLAFVPGGFGKIWAVIPAVVATTFAISWIEALFILPAHLAHISHAPRSGIGAKLHALQQRFSNAFGRFVEHGYGPFLYQALRFRYLTLAVVVGLLIVVVAIPVSGRMGFILMPKVEGDTAEATAVLPVSTPGERVRAVRDQIVGAARAVLENGDRPPLGQGVYARINENEITVTTYLRPPEERDIGTTKFNQLWREQLGPMPGVEYVRFDASVGGPGGGPSLSVELSHRRTERLERAAGDLARRLENFAVVKDVDDGYSEGKPQLDFRLTEEARALGLTAADIGRQIRYAFYGAEAIKQQRGRNEITVLVRRPQTERNSPADIEDMVLATPNGGEVPLFQVADVARGQSYTRITRRDSRRTTTVTGNVEPIGETSRVLAAVKSEILPQLTRDYPGLSYSFEGRQASMREALNSFYTTVSISLLIMFVLLAVPFRSYSQPLLVLLAIPFGVVGAILGHLIMGFSLSIISMMGIIALGGVVINDSLVMIDFANRRRRDGESVFTAIRHAGIERFRPILLTTLTTFGGLAPMIFETSPQARFLIPMALSLGYGILFATPIMLVLIPSLYLILDDIRRGLRALLGLGRPEAADRADRAASPKAAE